MGKDDAGSPDRVNFIISGPQNINAISFFFHTSGFPKFSSYWKVLKIINILQCILNFLAVKMWTTVCPVSSRDFLPYTAHTATALLQTGLCTGNKYFRNLTRIISIVSKPIVLFLF